MSPTPSMAPVSVRTGPISADDPARIVPAEKWFNLTLARRTNVHTNIPYDCQSLLGYIEEATDYRMWEHTGHNDLEDYIRRGLDIDPKLIEWAKLGLSVIGKEKPVSLDVAAEVGKAVELARRQADPESTEFVKPDGAKGIGKRGSNATALTNSERHSKPGTLRRLARTRPDLLARIEAGELSTHAAAIKAGIRRPMRSIPIDTPEAAIRALSRVFSPEALFHAASVIVQTPPPQPSPARGREQENPRLMPLKPPWRAEGSERIPASEIRGGRA